MKIAITAHGKDLDAQVSDKPGSASHLLVIDTSSGALSCFKVPGGSGPGAGLQFVTMAVSQECDAFVTGWLSPVGERQLKARGITVVTGVAGKAGDVLEKFDRQDSPGPLPALNSRALAGACRQAVFQIGGMLPVLAGVVFLVSLLAAFIPESALAGFFSGGGLEGIFRGALAGSLFTGNPANSYIIGGKLLDQGVGIGAVSALICTWVTVGIVQLPAEIAALGRRFALARNFLCFILSMGVALVMMGIFSLLEG